MSLEDWHMLTIGPILSNLPVNQQVSIIPQLVEDCISKEA